MMSRFSDYLAKRGLGEASPASTAANGLDRLLTVTFFPDRFASTKSEAQTTLRALVERIRDTEAPGKAELPWLKLATFGGHRTNGGSLRNDANVAEIHGVEADYDGEAITLDRARQVLGNASVAALLYTSPSHTEERPRWRILCPTSRPLPPDMRAGLVARINGLFVGALASESFTLSQSYYYGRVRGNAAHEVMLVEGRPIDIADDLDKEAIGRPAKQAASPPASVAPRSARQPLTDGGSPLGLSALEQRCQEIRQAADGEKHRAVNEAAYAIGGLVAAGELQEGVAWAELRGALADILHRCKDPKAAERTLRRAFEEGRSRPQDVPDRPEDLPLAPAVWTLTQQALARAKAARAPQAAPLGVSPDLMDVPGALRLFVDHCERTAISPQPFLALAAGICLVGALAGRRYRTSTDLRTNLYAVGIADSGGGKDHARKQIRRCLYAANLPQYLGGADIASGSGLRTAMARHPSMVFLIDEFGDWLRGVLGEKAPTHKAQIASSLKELYSSANTVWSGTEYADQSRQGRPREDIHQPNACLYGTSTPGQFWSAVAGANLHDGLMARMLLFVSPCSYPDERDPELAEPSPDLIEALQAIAAGPPDQEGNLGALMLATTQPAPMTVPETAEATEARRALRRHQLEQQRRHEGTYVTSIAGRLAENAMKLALVRAIARDPAAPVIQAQDVAWGQAVAQHCVDTLLREAGRHVADTDYEAKLNRALDYIRKHGPISARAMFNKGWRLPEREREEILRTLVENGLVLKLAGAASPEGGRPTVRYAVVEQPESGAIETSFDGAEDDN